MAEDGLDHALLHAGGIHIDNEITCDQNGATNVNVFTVSGAIKVLEIYACCSAERETPNVTFGAVHFDILDSNAGRDDITLQAGVDCATIEARAEVSRRNLKTAAAVFTNSDKSRVADPGLAAIYAPFNIIPYSVDGLTTIRFNYTGDANTDLDMHVHLRYIPLGNATVTAV